MKIDEKVIERLDKLIGQINGIRSKSVNTQHGTYYDREGIFQFGTSSSSFIERVFGRESSHYIKFNNQFNMFSTAQVNEFKYLHAMTGVLKAAKDDFENGYLFDTRTLIEAEVFDDFLEQAEQLFDKDYYQPAAVIAGCVLEDGLRKLCDKNSITLPAKATIEPMNVELRKADIYNKLWQKKITALADLRNKAAHGLWNEFEKKDVEDMIRDVRRFMEDYFS